MHATILATFLGISRIAVAMCSAGVVAFLIGVLAAKTEIARRAAWTRSWP
jgi:hypothetical protein